MSFADEKPRSIISSWGKAKITLSDTVYCGDIVGINASNAWYQAQAATTTIAGLFVAGEYGESGDEITAYRGAVVRGEGSTGLGAVAGEIGDPVYLSDTPGEYSLSVGTNLTQQVGRVISTNEVYLQMGEPVTANSIDSAHYVDGSIDEEHLAVFNASGGLNALRVATAEYDFAEDGGAASAISLGVTIPDNAVIIGGGVDVITTCTSGTDAGTGAISVEGANDIVTAVAIGTGTPWDAGGRDIIPDGTGTAQVKTTQARVITFTIAVEDFTAGRFFVYLFYLVTA